MMPIMPLSCIRNVKNVNLKLCENGSNVHYLYETNSVLKKPRKPKFRVKPFGFGSVPVFKTETEPKFGFCTSPLVALPVTNHAKDIHWNSSFRRPPTDSLLPFTSAPKSISTIDDHQNTQINWFNSQAGVQWVHTRQKWQANTHKIPVFVEGDKVSNADAADISVVTSPHLDLSAFLHTSP